MLKYLVNIILLNILKYYRVLKDNVFKYGYKFELFHIYNLNLII